MDFFWPFLRYFEFLMFLFHFLEKSTWIYLNNKKIHLNINLVSNYMKYVHSSLSSADLSLFSKHVDTLLFTKVFRTPKWNPSPSLKLISWLNRILNIIKIIPIFFSCSKDKTLTYFLRQTQFLTNQCSCGIVNSQLICPTS